MCAPRPTGLDLKGQLCPCLALRCAGCGTHPDLCQSPRPHGRIHSLPSPRRPAMLGTKARLCGPRGQPGSSPGKPRHKGPPPLLGVGRRGQGNDSVLFLAVFFFFWIFVCFLSLRFLTFANTMVMRNTLPGSPRHVCGSGL